MIQSFKTRTLAQYIKLSCQLREQWSSEAYLDPWFRGHTDARWRLTPNIYRLNLGQDEDQLRAEFRRRAAQLSTEAEPANDWGWYFLMQHHRAPTRLLDWTDGALIALFFALNSTAPGDDVRSDAAVWVLDPWWLNRRTLSRDYVLDPESRAADPYLPRIYSGGVQMELPVSIDPPHVARRVAAQHSRFTIHGTREDGLTEVGSEDNSRLVKITIPRAAIGPMRRDLLTCGIVDTTVFPDLEGLSRELTRYWSE